MKNTVQSKRQESCRDSCYDWRCKSAGSSLISLSLLIVVLGVFTVGGLLLAKQDRWTQKSDASLATVTQIEDALKNYFAVHGYFACPAGLTDGPDDAGFGQSNCSGAMTVPGARNVPSVPASGERVKIGAIPVRSLNLPDSAMVDGWGHRLIYAVTEYYTGSGSNFNADRGTIRIIDAEGDSMTPTAPSSVVYAVIMPGADTRGAYNMAGKLINNCESGTQAEENCDYDDAVFRSAVLKQYNTANAEYTANTKYVAIEKDYHWEAAAWEPCECTGNATASPDANPVQDRQTPSGYDTVGSNNGVRCLNQSGNQVADSECLASERPKASQSCAAFCWKVLPPPSCSCSVSSVSETVTCERYYDNDDDIMNDQNCTEFTGLAYVAKTQSCPNCNDSSGCTVSSPCHAVNNGVPFTYYGTPGAAGETSYQPGWNNSGEWPGASTSSSYCNITGC